MRLLYGGLDVGSSNCHFTALNDRGQVEASVEIPTSELHITALLSSFKSDEKLKLHLEASELSRWIRSVVTYRKAVRSPSNDKGRKACITSNITKWHIACLEL